MVGSRQLEIDTPMKDEHLQLGPLKCVNLTDFPLAFVMSSQNIGVLCRHVRLT